MISSQAEGIRTLPTGNQADRRQNMTEKPVLRIANIVNRIVDRIQGHNLAAVCSRSPGTSSGSQDLAAAGAEIRPRAATQTKLAQDDWRDFGLKENRSQASDASRGPTSTITLQPVGRGMASWRNCSQCLQTLWAIRELSGAS